MRFNPEGKLAEESKELYRAYLSSDEDIDIDSFVRKYGSEEFVAFWDGYFTELKAERETGVIT